MVIRNLKNTRYKVRTALHIIGKEAAALQEVSTSQSQKTSIRRILQAKQRLLKFVDSLSMNLPLATSPSATASFANVLLVEDSPIIQQAHTLLLQELGYHVDVAANGKEALARFNKHYDVILMDIGLPDQSGIAVTEKIRQLEKKFVPIIMLTAQSDEALKKASFKAGANAFLVKPTPPKKLDEIIRHWLQIKPSQSTSRRSAKS